jgi:antitoxin ParD1/3/4
VIGAIRFAIAPYGFVLIWAMTITLTPEQQAWLKAKVERGEFPSVEEAARRLIDERMAEESDDLAWAKPYVDEARAAVARGEFISLDEHKARNAARLSAMKG